MTPLIPWSMQNLKDVDRVLPDIVPDLKKILPCQLTHQNVAKLNVKTALKLKKNIISIPGKRSHWSSHLIKED